ncbi:MAG: type II toxin-antitoxin system VapC family toxin [Bifidobacteriaceae bacterium]|jgi:predicted nucleic acid-binding protein|nr:type II toxin-antitoxin system VapC family toxin [Bifidobacteriaceae bacterium]
MGERLLAPQLIDVEVAASWRRLVAAGQLSQAAARSAIHDLAAFPLRRVSHPWLLERCWELRHNLTIYDAVYVALAEAYQAVLLTADHRLAGAPGPRCDIEVVKDR